MELLYFYKNDNNTYSLDELNIDENINNDIYLKNNNEVNIIITLVDYLKLLLYKYKINDKINIHNYIYYIIDNNKSLITLYILNPIDN